MPFKLTVETFRILPETMTIYAWGGGGGGRNPEKKWVGMLVASLMGVNFGF